MSNVPGAFDPAAVGSLDVEVRYSGPDVRPESLVGGHQSYLEPAHARFVNLGSLSHQHQPVNCLVSCCWNLSEE